MRPAAQDVPQRQLRSQTVSLPAPVGGWNAKDSLAAMPETDCVTLDNWLVRTQGLVTRAGIEDWVGEIDGAVETLLPYNPSTGGGEMLFAATDDSIYNVTDQTPEEPPPPVGFDPSQPVI